MPAVLRLERQNKFATNKQKAKLDPRESAETTAKKKGKRGAPKGHAPWYRKMPTEYDVRVDVGAPRRCPRCDSRNIAVYSSQAAMEHLQEDIVDGRYHVTQPPDKVMQFIYRKTSAKKPSA